MNEISQSQLTVFYQLFSSRNTCEKVPHRRLCSGKSLHSKPSAAFCGCGEREEQRPSDFSKAVCMKNSRKEQVQGQNCQRCSSVPCWAFSTSYYWSCMERCRERSAGNGIIIMKVVCRCVAESQTNIVFISRPTRLWSCSRSDLQWHHSSEHELISVDGEHHF